MDRNSQQGSARHLPGVVFAALFIYVFLWWLHPGDWSRVAALLAAAYLGWMFVRDAQGLREALQAKATFWILFWTLVGGAGAGGLALLGKHYSPNAAGFLGWLLSGTTFDAWLRCTLFGSLGALLEVGAHYRLFANNQKGEVPAC